MRCHNCRDKFEVKYFLQKYCLLKEECIEASNKARDIPKRARDVPKPINKVSDRRKKEELLYSVVRKQYLKDNPNCEICDSSIVEIHHKNGRNGKRIHDTKYFMTICRGHHIWIHEHPKEAREKGWLV